MTIWAAEATNRVVARSRATRARCDVHCIKLSFNFLRAAQMSLWGGPNSLRTWTVSGHCKNPTTHLRQAVTTSAAQSGLRFYGFSALRCRLRVKIGPDDLGTRLPLCPQERTFQILRTTALRQRTKPLAR